MPRTRGATRKAHFEHQPSTIQAPAEHNLSTGRAQFEHQLSTIWASAEHNLSTSRAQFEHRPSTIWAPAEHNLSISRAQFEHQPSTIWAPAEHNLSTSRAEHILSTSRAQVEHQPSTIWASVGSTGWSAEANCARRCRLCRGWRGGVCQGSGRWGQPRMGGWKSESPWWKIQGAVRRRRACSTGGGCRKPRVLSPRIVVFVCVCLFFFRIPFFGWKRVGCRRPEPIKYKPVFLDPLGQGCFYTGQPPGGPMALLYFRCFQAPPEGKIQLEGASLNHI